MISESHAAVPGRLRFFAPPSPHHLLVVRRDQRALHRYLLDSFRHVSGIEVILDRREPSPPSGAQEERRRSRAEFDAFGLLIVRR